MMGILNDLLPSNTKEIKIFSLYKSIPPNAGWKKSMDWQIALLREENVQVNIYSLERLKLREVASLINSFFKSNVIYLHCSFLQIGFPSFLLALFSRKRLVIRASGGELQNLPWIKKIFYKRADHILTLNDCQFQIASKIGKPRRILNPSRFSFNKDIYLRKCLNNREGLNILFVGHFCLRKGVDRLLHIVDATLDLSLQFVLIGGFDEMDSDSYMLVDQLKSYENVTIHDYKKNLFKYFEEADILLLPSRSEGMPNVFIEAISFSCLPIGFDNASGVKEIIEQLKLPYLTPCAYVHDFRCIIRAFDHKKNDYSNYSQKYSSESWKTLMI